MRIVIVDDNPGFLRVLRHFFESQGEFTVVGAAASGSEALRVLDGLACDVVLVDYDMPTMDGFELVRELKVRSPPVRAVILTSYSEEEYARHAEAAGADGLMTKDRIEDELIPFLRRLRGDRRATDHDRS